jgi:predicted O-linked N-acetylglucosamine transferase (SPINDLY family)
MDYRFTDGAADPDGFDAHHTERLCRFPGSFLCYRPPEDAPTIAPPPFINRKHITFGSFNNLSKVTDEVIAVWCGILSSVPESRILLKCKPFCDEGVRKNVIRKFAHGGVAEDRLQLVGHSASVKDHLEWYGKVDIALDPFPYNGTTTTCEALWMGVPVVSRIGNRHASRVGLSILRNVGLGGLAAGSNEQYTALAGYLAGDVNRLSKLRFSLREAVANSPLCDAYSFTSTLENAYRRLWEHTGV